MPHRISQLAARLELDGEQLVHANLSGAAFVGHELWVAGDEACGLDRLKLLPSIAGETLRFGEAQHFPLADVLDLPDAFDVEADIEGLDYHGDCLWLVGSHGLKRKAPKDGYDNAANLRRLATVSADGNRCLLAKIPLQKTENGYTPVKHSDTGHKAIRLRGDTKGNDLTALLKKDRHYGAYLDIPGKDNGFDIEGLAVQNERVLIGLRGPVLRGWAGLIEVNVKEKSDELRLAKIAGSKQKYRKHFIHLAGLGIRDLHWTGDDLIILAGPTMVLDGAIRLYRWANAAQAFANVDPNATEVLWQPSPEQLGPVEMLTLPMGIGQDRAEAITCLPSELSNGELQWLVLYDAPSAARQPAEQVVLADIVQLSAPAPRRSRAKAAAS